MRADRPNFGPVRARLTWLASVFAIGRPRSRAWRVIEWPGHERECASESLGRDSYGARAWRNRCPPWRALVNTVWVVIGLGIAGALVALIASWSRGNHAADLGA